MNDFEILVRKEQEVLRRLTLTISNNQVMAEVYDGQRISKLPLLSETDVPKLTNLLNLRMLEAILCEFKGFAETNINQKLLKE